MPIPIAKEQKQFDVPTAASPEGRAGRVLPVNTGLPEATEKLTKAMFSAHDVLAKMRVESDSAKASNDFLAYKKQMNDLLYSNELDENGNPKGFIYQTGENAFKSLKEYDTKASSLYQEFTKKLSNYLPVATENAFKSANAYNETFREMLMKHSAQENEKFQEESLSAYVADTIANVDAGMLSYGDNAEAFFDTTSADLSNRIMQYYILKGFPQKGKELYQKENAKLLEATLQQVALNHSNDFSPFGGYDAGENLLNHIKEQNKLRGTEVVKTKDINDLGKMYALREFENAFINPNFNYDTFMSRIRKSQWLDELDKTKWQIKYEDKLEKARKAGYGNNIKSQSDFLYEVHQGVAGDSYSSGDLQYIASFFPYFTTGEFALGESTAVDPETKQAIKNEDGSVKKTYFVNFKDKRAQQMYDSLPNEYAKNLVTTFVYNYSKGNWMIPTPEEADTLISLSVKLNSIGTKDEQQANFLMDELERQIQDVTKISSTSSPIIKTSKGKDGKVDVEAYSSEENYVKNLNLLIQLEKARNDGTIDEKRYKKNKELLDLAIKQVDPTEFNNGVKLIHKGLIGNFLGIPEMARKIDTAMTTRYRKAVYSERGSNIGKLKTALSMVTGAFMYEQIDPETAATEAQAKNSETLNFLSEQAKRYDGKAVQGYVQHVSRTLMDEEMDVQYKLADKGGIGLNVGLSGYTQFRGTLTPEDWNLIRTGFMAKVCAQKGWNDQDAYDRYTKEIENNPLAYKSDYRDYVANYITNNKSGGIYTSEDGEHWKERNGSLPFQSDMVYKDNIGYVRPYTLVRANLTGPKETVNETVVNEGYTLPVINPALESTVAPYISREKKDILLDKGNINTEQGIKRKNISKAINLESDITRATAIATTRKERK